MTTYRDLQICDQTEDEFVVWPDAFPELVIAAVEVYARRVTTRGGLAF